MPSARTAAVRVAPSTVIEILPGGTADVLPAKVPARLIDAVPERIDCDDVRPRKLVSLARR